MIAVKAMSTTVLKVRSLSDILLSSFNSLRQPKTVSTSHINVLLRYGGRRLPMPGTEGDILLSFDPLVYHLFGYDKPKLPTGKHLWSCIEVLGERVL